MSALRLLTMSALRRALPNLIAMRVAERVALTVLYLWTISITARLFGALKLPWLDREGPCRTWILSVRWVAVAFAASVMTLERVWPASERES